MAESRYSVELLETNGRWVRLADMPGSYDGAKNMAKRVWDSRAVGDYLDIRIVEETAEVTVRTTYHPLSYKKEIIS